MDDRYRKGFERMLADTQDGPSWEQVSAQRLVSVGRPWLRRPAVVAAGTFAFTLVFLGLSMLVFTLGDDTPPASALPALETEWGPELRFDPSHLGRELVLDRSTPPGDSVADPLGVQGLRSEPVFVGTVDGWSGYIAATESESGFCMMVAGPDSSSAVSCPPPRTRDVAYVSLESNSHVALYSIQEPGVAVFAVQYTAAGGQVDSYWQRPYASSALIVRERVPPDTEIVVDLYDAEGNLILSDTVVEGPETTTTVPELPETPAVSVYGLNPWTLSEPGIVTVEGHVDRPADVTADGATNWTNNVESDGRTGFYLEFDLGLGTHSIEIDVQADDGSSTSHSLTIVVDPSVERFMAYITGFEVADDGRLRLNIDEAEWLEGREAIDAMIEDGEIGSEDEFNGFYVRNEFTEIRDVGVAFDASIAMYVCFAEEGPARGPCVAPWPVSVDRFRAMLADPELPIEAPNGQRYGSNDVPFWFTSDGTGIIQIEEQYLP